MIVVVPLDNTTTHSEQRLASPSCRLIDRVVEEPSCWASVPGRLFVDRTGAERPWRYPRSVSLGAPDYFVNLERNRRFPWSLYHEPIEDDLEAFLRAVAAERPSGKVLVIGCGLMQEMDRAPAGLEFTVVDIDPRAIEAVRAQRHSAIASLLVVTPDTDLAALGRKFDAVYAKEVIEHIVRWKSYLDSLRSILHSGGRLWLSTPNYGEPWLPVLETTALELIARRSGYTRRGLHPSRFSGRGLDRALRETGFVDVRVRVVARRLALTAWGRA